MGNCIRPVPLGQSAGYVVARRHEIVIILGEIIYVNRPKNEFGMMSMVHVRTCRVDRKRREGRFMCA